VFGRTGPQNLGGRNFHHKHSVLKYTKEPEMLQADAFCEHTMQQNATVPGSATVLCGGKWEMGGKGTGGEGRERGREWRKGRGGKVGTGPPVG